MTWLGSPCLELAKAPVAFNLRMMSGLEKKKRKFCQHNVDEGLIRTSPKERKALLGI